MSFPSSHSDLLTSVLVTDMGPTKQGDPDTFMDSTHRETPFGTCIQSFKSLGFYSQSWWNPKPYTHEKDVREGQAESSGSFLSALGAQSGWGCKDP